jgi:hypothetical protein
LNPEVAIIFGAAALYRRAKVCSRQDDAHPDISTLHAGKMFPAPLHIFRVAHLPLRKRRGAAGNGLGATAKYLRQTMNGASGIGLGTTAKYLQRTTSAAAGKSLGTTANYLRRITSTAEGNGRAQFSSSFDEQ